MSAQQFSRPALGIIDTVVNLWTAEALSFRPGWQAGFYVDKMRGQSADMTGLTLAQLIGLRAGPYRKLMRDNAVQLFKLGI